MVQRWEILTIGNLSRNRYWGEGDDRARRPAICTCTLVVTRPGRLLVDPSLSEADSMARKLDRQTGLKPRRAAILSPRRSAPPQTPSDPRKRCGSNML